MAEQTESQGNWRGWSDWPFTSIFRSFRMAISPGKLALAFLGVLLLVLWGWLLDGIWPQRHQPLTGEVASYWQVPDYAAWREQTEEAEASRLRVAWAQMGATPSADLRDRYRNDPNGEVNRALDELKHRYDAAARGAQRPAVADTARDYNERYIEIASLYRQPIFQSFVNYEGDVLRHLVDAAGSLNFTGGLQDVLTGRSKRMALVAPTGLQSLGVLPNLIVAARGVQWLIGNHPMFTLLLAAGALAIWALFGGAIARMAAMDVARDERIPMGTAVNFARRKYLAFLTAPLLPLALLALVGICLFIYGVILSIPYFGDVLGSVLLFLPIIGGGIMALVIIGAAAGKSLFYPTIAVEGSDSFDAMSRSYSYIYSRPWRALGYGLVALIYGALCYFFVRFFALLALKAARFSVKLGSWPFTSRPGTGRTLATKVDAMWPNPAFNDFWPGQAPFGTANGWEWFWSSWVIWFWVALVSLVVAAFLVSFYLSASTVIYYLLRRVVDATDMEEVYLDEEPEAEAETAGAIPASSGTEPATAPPPTLEMPAESPPPPETPGTV